MRRDHGPQQPVVTALLLWALSTAAVSAAPTTSGVLAQDETWRGRVQLTGDVVVPPGITLTLAPGTTVTVTPQQSDHDVVVWRRRHGRQWDLAHAGLIDLIVQGHLQALGGWWWWQCMRFGSAGKDVVGWGGLLFVGDTKSRLVYTTVHHAFSAVRCLDRAVPEIRYSVLKVNVHGLEAYQEAMPRLLDSRVRANFRGMGVFDRAAPQLHRTVIRANNQGLLIADSATPTVMHVTFSANTTAVLIQDGARPLLHQNLASSGQACCGVATTAAS